MTEPTGQPPSDPRDAHREQEAEVQRYLEERRQQRERLMPGQPATGAR